MGDKMQFMEEIRIKDNKINELQIKNVSNNKLIKELREPQLAKIDINQQKKQKEHVQQQSFNEVDDNKQQMIALLDTARKYKSQNEKNSVEINKLREKLKAYKRRDEVNKQLRDNWNKQLNQMEQAVLLANEIYNRERTRHEAEMAEKDVEIMKLRKFLLSFTNRHAKSTKSINGGTKNGSMNGHSHSNGSHHHTLHPNGPGAARKSKIVKPKVIKTGRTNGRNSFLLVGSFGFYDG